MTTIFSTQGHQGEDTPDGKSIFSTAKSPKAIGPYSKAVKSGKLLFCSGQIGVDPTTLEFPDETIESQTERACMNVVGLLEEYGAEIHQVIKTTVFLVNMNDYQTVNEIYGKYFSHKPARSCVAVAGLPKGALIEIEVIAEV